jgi:hypothetical protein
MDLEKHFRAQGKQCKREGEEVVVDPRFRHHRQAEYRSLGHSVKPKNTNIKRLQELQLLTASKWA